MSFISVAIGGSALVGAYSANKAAKAQAGAAREQADVARDTADQQIALQREIYGDTNAKFQPFYDEGVNALSTYTDQLGTAYNKSPGYDARFQGGVDAVTAAGAASGGIGSGSTLKRLTEYGQEFASNDYQNWLNRVGGLMSDGQNAAGQQAASGQNFSVGAGNALANQGAALSSAYGNMGNASAAGAIGVNNALQGGVQNYLALNQYQKQLSTPYNMTAPTGAGGIY